MKIITHKKKNKKKIIKPPKLKKKRKTFKEKKQYIYFYGKINIIISNIINKSVLTFAIPLLLGVSVILISAFSSELLEWC